VGVAQRIAFFVAHCFEELVDPDRGVDCEAFAIEGWERGRSCAGLENGPETGDTHCEVEFLLKVMSMV
jgi:hypothetical protein